MSSIIDRLASHAAAGCRGSQSTCRSGCWSRGPAFLSCQACILLKSGVGGRERATLCSPLKSNRKTSTGSWQRHALQAVDYSFYLSLEPIAITPDYLWENRLLPLLDYLSDVHRSEVRKALNVAYESHKGQNRKSGEPFITHPVEVSRILAELRMDYESLVAGLLHDTVEDTDKVSFQQIGVWFGPAVRKIVEGETKISKLGAITSPAASTASTKADMKALDLRQLFLNMAEEIRIIVVKLADRLHNMRTLNSMPAHKQKKIADETLQVFAPLARLLGLYSIKEELEDLSFRYSDSATYCAVCEKVGSLVMQQKPFLQEAKEKLEDRLRQDGYLAAREDKVSVEVVYKPVYSVYRRMLQKNKDSVDISDLAQLCVVITEQQLPESLYGSASHLCYHVLGVVHTMWTPVANGLKDYIAAPKPNGYQSLHTMVLPIGSKRVLPLQVLIRTAEMQRHAEYGFVGENWGAAGSFMNYIQDSQSQMLTGDAVDIAEEDPINGCKVNGHRVNGYHVNGSKTERLNGKADGEADRGPSPPGVLGSYFPVNGRQILKEAVSHNAPKLDQKIMLCRVNWLHSIREWQEEFLTQITAREFVDCVTKDLLGQGVLVFNPRGALMRLPLGATVVDFAYYIGTDMGNCMRMARVNNVPVPASHVLKEGEVVEIVPYSGQVSVEQVKRLRSWLQHAKTRSAQLKLTKFLNEHENLLDKEAADAVVGLVIECDDRTGLLADVSSTITRHGSNIEAYNGQRKATGEKRFLMHFEVKGDPSQLDSMCAQLKSIEGVVSVSEVDVNLDRN